MYKPSDSRNCGKRSSSHLLFRPINPPSQLSSTVEWKERERENNKCQTKRNFPLPRRFSAYPWPWPRFTCSFSSWPLPTRDDRCYVKGRPLVPCSRKVRSMILRRANNVFPLEGRCYVSTKQGRLFGEQGGNGGGRGALGGASNLPIHSGESRLRPNSSS